MLWVASPCRDSPPFRPLQGLRRQPF